MTDAELTQRREEMLKGILDDQTAMTREAIAHRPKPTPWKAGDAFLLGLCLGALIGGITMHIAYEVMKWSH